MRKRGRWMGLMAAGLALVASLCLEVAPILSNSMAPLLLGGRAGRDIVLVERVSRHLRGPQRWEVVTLADPRDPARTLIKRVVGLPGESVAIRDGAIQVDGAPVEGPADGSAPRYVPSGRTRWEVPEGCVVVLGDNSGSSLDSRAFGVVPVDSIRGRLVANLSR